VSRPEAPPSLFTPAPLPIAELTPAQRIACLRLVRTDGVGPTLFRDLINHYGGAEAALDALPELARRGGGSRPLRLCPRARAEAELEAAARIGATPVFTIEPGYPPHLAQVEAPPPMLYVKGDVSLLQRPAISIVGSRAASAAGHKLAGLFARDLGRAGLVIASGLARGIDAAAHEAALATGTVAVLAGGIDFVYPPEHAALQRQIGDTGCLLTEMPPGFQPRAKDFPRRNRLIAGLALGVVVVEAARRSGTLVTARFAAEQGREVFAIPAIRSIRAPKAPTGSSRAGPSSSRTPATCSTRSAHGCA
jgi:DNA processing protein